MQRRELVLQLFAQRVDVRRIIVVVDRVGLLLPDDAAVKHVGGLRQADLLQLDLRLVDESLVARGPQAIALEAEVLEPVATHRRVRHHLRRPRFEVLHPAHLNPRIVDVDPVIVDQAAVLEDGHDGDEVPVFERVGGPPCLVRHPR